MRTETQSQQQACHAVLPYGRHWVDEDDIRLVVEVLRGDWLTTGPMVERFEQAFAQCAGVCEAVAVSSGTAALHAAMFALAIGAGDEVVVPAMTFAATANCVVYQGATPVFADVEPDTLLIGPAQVEARLTPRTRAIIAVDYAGQPCDYVALRAIAQQHDLALVADACHALGARDQGVPVGSLADLTAFSLHPLKPITSGEGGMTTTSNADWARRMRQFRNHGFARDHHARSASGCWHYEMADLGYNYRLSDIQCALGFSQLAKLGPFIARRQEIARRYDRAFAGLAGIKPLGVRPGVSHGRHLYVVRLDPRVLTIDRAAVFGALRHTGISAAVHYPPVHLHPYYRKHFHTRPGLCPVAEAAYEEVLSLPIFPSMTDEDVARVIEVVQETVQNHYAGLGSP